jgi:farnesyl-diphosphate farnesyltransferase
MPMSPEPTAFEGVTREDRDRLLTDILREVSRAFYLTLRALPSGVREPVALAYLLARAADTVADTPTLEPKVRLRCLLEFRDQVEGPPSPAVLQRLQREAQAETSGEEALLSALPAAFALLEDLETSDRVEVRRIVRVLIRGMEMDLVTFPGALAEAADLDEYTWLVAGCVGEFWTRETMAHIRALRDWDVQRMVALGCRFGKALQLTNILRDLPRDLRAGRCYLPAGELLACGLAPHDLVGENLAQAWPVLERWVRVALGHFHAAEDYARAIPLRCLRLRLAVLWPILIGLQTLALLVRSPRWLDPACRVKVCRPWIYRMLVFSVPAALCPPLLNLWLRRLHRRIEEALRRGPC